MKRPVATVLLSLGIAGIALAAQPAGQQPAPSAEPLVELETVLVVGEQPGPGLWKISKGDHVLWVLANFSPLSPKVTWRSKQIEDRIAESQEVLYPPEVNLKGNVGILRGLTLIPAALKAGKNPDGKKLKEVLPADIYAKWRVLREKYIGKDDDVEKWRPSIALETLNGTALRKSGLSGSPVAGVVTKAAKQHKVRVNVLPAINRTLDIQDPRGMLKGASKVEEPDLACFVRGLDSLEGNIERAKANANAWARGDIEKLRSLNRERRLEDVCIYQLLTGFTDSSSKDAAHARKLLEDTKWHVEWAQVQAMQDWVAAAQKALEKNRSTFSVLPVDQVFRKDGAVEKLRALGYVVEEPR
jgi:soluble cytochrome b562